MIKHTLLYLSYGLLLFTSCSRQAIPSDKPGENEQPSTSTGYTALLLGENIENPELSALARIDSGGEIEEDVWQQANGTSLAGNPRDLYVSGDKVYILCGEDGDGSNTDGGLIIADARTLKRQKSFALATLQFPKPEGTGPTYKPLLKTPTNVAVIDDSHIYLKDAQGVFRLDAVTGKLTVIEGTYHIANTIQGYGNLESKVASKGLVITNGKLYVGSAGFWSDQSGIMEIAPDRDSISRNMEFNVDLFSGIVKGKDHELLIAQYVRQQQNGVNKASNKISRIDLNTFQQPEILCKPTQISLSPGFYNQSGVAYDGGEYLYLSEIKEEEMETVCKLTLNRIRLSDGKTETVANFKDEAPGTKYLTTNPVINPANQSLYVSVSNTLNEGEKSDSYVLVYDISGEQPVLKHTIGKHTSKTVAIRFL